MRKRIIKICVFWVMLFTASCNNESAPSESQQDSSPAAMDDNHLPEVDSTAAAVADSAYMPPETGEPDSSRSIGGRKKGPARPPR